MTKPQDIHSGLTVDRLREVLSYDGETGVFMWEVRLQYNCRQGQRTKAGCIGSDGRLKIAIDGRSFMAHRLAWLYVHGKWPVNLIDHINGDPLDNRIANLRDVNNSENQFNKRSNRNNTSEFRGVTFNKKRQAWYAQIGYNGKMKHLGTFRTKEDASAAFQKAAAIHHAHRRPPL